VAKQRPRRDPGTPLFLPPSVAALLGDESDALLAALTEESPVSIRYNPLKPFGPVGQRVPWCERGRYLHERPVFTLDPLLHAGTYYVQEASSTLLEQAFKRTGLSDQAILALDLCAAPGGKSTHLASLLNGGSLLVCNEVVAARRDALSENLWKHGFPNTMISGNAPEDFGKLPDSFGLVLVDAPCSGEGMFRKDPFAREQWNEKLVASCARTQSDILRHAWATVRPGGWLIYSTCTWERSENEEQVLDLVRQGAEYTPIPMADAWGVVATDLGYRCYPHRVKGEGFFIALLRKPGAFTPYSWVPRNGRTRAEVTAWLNQPEAWDIIEDRDVLFASPAQWSGTMEKLLNTLRLTSPGIPVAERKGAIWRPHPALALNRLLDQNAFPDVALREDQALTFLRGETALPLGSNAEGGPGVRLMRYAGLPLGWMHAAGDRWNNGWPKPWRIRMR
jgi:16S rRNA C967 or C1407 C5-methylase (RsmB/RsmF family)